jgi:hypothetical protein
MTQMDEIYEKHHMWAQPKLSMKPSELCRRQVHVTFQNDPVGVHNRRSPASRRSSGERLSAPGRHVAALARVRRRAAEGRRRRRAARDGRRHGGAALRVRGAVSLRDRTAIVGAGTTAYGTRGQFYGRSQLEQIREALDLRLDESGIDRREIDGFASYSVDANDPARLAPGLGIPNVNFSNMVLGGGGGGTCGAIANAAAAIVAGLAKTVMVYKVITQPPHARFGAAYGLAQAAADPYADFHKPFGLVSPAQFFAMIFRRHMHRYGTDPLALAEVA